MIQVVDRHRLFAQIGPTRKLLKKRRKAVQMFLKQGDEIVLRFIFKPLFQGHAECGHIERNQEAQMFLIGLCFRASGQCFAKSLFRCSQRVYIGRGQSGSNYSNMIASQKVFTLLLIQPG